MPISNFPAALQPAIQTGMLARQFQDGLRSRLGYRVIADRDWFPHAIGETLTKTRYGLKSAITTAQDPTTNTGLDNGLVPSSFDIEQYSMRIDQYTDTIDLNLVSTGVGIAKQFPINARVNGEQAGRSVDTIARNALYFGIANKAGQVIAANLGGYLGGNTRVSATLAAAGATVQVDDVRGFQYTMSLANVPTQVSNMNPQTVVVGSGDYTCVGVIVDPVSTSTAPEGGLSGTLMFSTNVAVADATAGQPVVCATAPVVMRPNGRATTAALVAGDRLTLQMCIDAQATMRDNGVPDVYGCYNCYLDNTQMAGLFTDPQFQLLYRGQYKSEAYQTGMIVELVGLRFIPTTQAPQQRLAGVGAVHRAIVVGMGALIEGNYQDMAATVSTMVDGVTECEMVDDICQVTRMPLDRLGQIIAQSWYWIGGYAVPTDATANTRTIPTANNSYLKRAIVLETL